MDNFGRIPSDLRNAGRLILELDLLIAATVVHHDLVLIIATCVTSRASRSCRSTPCPEEVAGVSSSPFRNTARRTSITGGDDYVPAGAPVTMTRSRWAPSSGGLS